MTEVFQLARVSSNRLAPAVSTTGQIWNPNILQQMGPTFDCTSPDCFSCNPDHGIPAFGEEPGCTCGTVVDVSSDGDEIVDVEPGLCLTSRIGAASTATATANSWHPERKSAAKVDSRAG